MTSFFPACSIFMNYAEGEEIKLPSCDAALLSLQAPMPVGCFVQTFNHKWSPGLGPALESSLIHVCKGPAGKIKADWQRWAAADTCPHLSSTMPRIWQEATAYLVKSKLGMDGRTRLKNWRLWIIFSHARLIISFSEVKLWISSQFSWSEKPFVAVNCSRAVQSPYLLHLRQQHAHKSHVVLLLIFQRGLLSCGAFSRLQYQKPR